MSIDPRVASGLRDVPPSVMIPRERMLEMFRKDVRLVRLRAHRDALTSSGWKCSPARAPAGTRSAVDLRRCPIRGGGGGQAASAVLTGRRLWPGPSPSMPVHRGTPFKRDAIGSVFPAAQPSGNWRSRELAQCDFYTVGRSRPWPMRRRRR